MSDNFTINGYLPFRYDAGAGEWKGKMEGVHSHFVFMDVDGAERLDEAFRRVQGFADFRTDGETLYSLLSYGYFTEEPQAPATAEKMMMSVTTAAKIIMETVAANMALQIHGETLDFANINGEALELSAVNGGDFSIERIFSNPAEIATSYYSQSFEPYKTTKPGDTLVLFDGYFAFGGNETLQQIA